MRTRTKTPSRRVPPIRQHPLVQARAARAMAQELKARFDSAATTDENRRHWANADAMSAVAAMIPAVRTTLRRRGRYVADNNAYFKGMLLTLANDVVGIGPRLQMLTEDSDENRRTEAAFRAWAQEVKFNRKLRRMRIARAASGEVYMMLTSRQKLDHPVKLFPRVFEADQVAAPLSFIGDYDSDRYDDGILYDEDDEPVEYHLLNEHPGSDFFGTGSDYVAVPAGLMIHYFRDVDRPGIHHGIPEIATGMMIAEEGRRWTMAVLAAMETVADHALAVEQDATLEEDAVTPAGTGEGSEEADIRNFDTFPLARRLITVLPRGCKLSQVKPEQPGSAYGEFADRVVREYARCINMPFSRAALDFSKDNLSAAYLGDKIYANATLVDRTDLGDELSRLFRLWHREFSLSTDGVTRFAPDEPIPHKWVWPRLPGHADPAKVANARSINLSNGVSNPAREIEEDGNDWETEQEMAAKAYGISIDEYRELLRLKTFGAIPVPPEPPGKPEDEDEEEAEDAEAE